MTDSHIDEVPEFANIDSAERRSILKKAGASAGKQLDEIKETLKIPNLTGIETKSDSIINIPVCIETFRVLGLQVGPNQRMQKRVFERWREGDECFQATYTLDFQFTGYGAYCMSFEKDASNSGLFSNFFRDIAAYRVNFHRTMLFVQETYENSNANNVQRLLLDGDGRNTSPDPNYLANLDRFVVAAKAYGVVVEVCLFMHHSVANSAGATPPRPVVLTGSSHERYKAFYNTASAFLPMQTKLIDGVVNKLRNHWNVVYEIGNEMRVPQPTSTYGQPQLKAWMDWAAARIRVNDNSHLITVSTAVENESDVHTLSRIQFCSFHQGQWTANINGACDRANGYGQRHVVMDDDGGSRTTANVIAWSKAALNARGGCRASFNHKGQAPINAYDPQWTTRNPLPGEAKPIEALTAIRDARNTSTSPCAGN